RPARPALCGCNGSVTAATTRTQAAIAPMTLAFEALAAGWKARHGSTNPLPDRLAQALGDHRPSDAELLSLFGMIATQAGRPHLAAALLARAGRRPDDGATLTLQVGGRTNGSAAPAPPPAPPQPDPAEQHSQAGVGFVKEGKLAEAEAAF